MNSNYCYLIAITTLFWSLSPAQTRNSSYGRKGRAIPQTRFTCQGRASGYYADIETGCQVYHMCDGLGRQFSYTCPNTTLFQQRMLVCDHWYMVNCSRAESDYGANLLIGQRDKPFVSEAEMQLRTPRPDILSVPLNTNYFDGLKEAETKYQTHPGNSIVGVADSISSANNGLDSGKQSYRPPTSWSTGKGVVNNPIDDNQLTSGSSNHEFPTKSDTQQAGTSFEPTPTPTVHFRPNVKIPPPSQDLVAPDFVTTEKDDQVDSDEFKIDMRMRTESPKDPVYNFIRRFDPNSPDSHKTSMTILEIIDLNKQLPDGHEISSEDERTPRRQKNTGTNFNNVEMNSRKGGVTEPTRFDTVNYKPTTVQTFPGDDGVNSFKTDEVQAPERVLLPPKKDYSQHPSTTMGPPVYYEWKWAVPAFDLEPPKESNDTRSPSPQTQTGAGNAPFRNVTRPTPRSVEPTPTNTEYNISSYFVPDYVFPLDKPHPGYENQDAQTSFQVQVARPGRASYGENLNCPECHPAFLKPGSCEPCIVRR